MFHRIIGGIVCIGFLAVAGSLVAQDVSSLNGQWHVRRAIMNGSEVPDDALASMKLTVNNGDFTAESGGLSSQGKFANGGSADQLSVKINSGADSGRDLKAKFRMENGELTIAYSQSNFPTSFNSAAGSNILVLIYGKGARPVSASRSATASNEGQPKATSGTTGGRVSGDNNTMSIDQ